MSTLFEEKYEMIPMFSKIESRRLSQLKISDKNHQLELGQFFTPSITANFMAKMFHYTSQDISLLDPGAGIGSLSAAFVFQAISQPIKPKRISITAFELDPVLIDLLTQTLDECKLLAEENQISFTYEIAENDFIESSVQVLLDRNSLFSVNQKKFDYAILNPPYKKINNETRTKSLLRAANIDTTNLYTAFVWLTLELLEKNGQLVAITPRSFCNGSYFYNFRKYLLSSFSFSNIHVFNSRNKAFSDDNVLQENIIFSGLKDGNQKAPVTITSNDNPSDPDISIRQIDYDSLVEPKDKSIFIRIAPNSLSSVISTKINEMPCSLHDLDLTISTGKVVDFRKREHLLFSPDLETIPLLYPGNFVNHEIIWPSGKVKKPNYLASNPETEKITVANDYYVLLKRFSSKEEKRRIYAAFYDPQKFTVKRIGIENHLNYFHRRYGGLSKELAKGLTLYLNSTLVDEFFRQFSGHTQVNASDIRSLRYPTKNQLIALGEQIGDGFPDQNTIDQLLAMVLSSNEEEIMAKDPIQAKKKVNEALSILQSLNVPRAQQNDRSALTLLSLTNVDPTNHWKKANKNLIGITEMMDFFRDHYGVNYAPNTRETVRRQTIHQFLQMNLVTANPDDPERPINSPKTKYEIKDDFLSLLQSYETFEWKRNLTKYFESNPNLQSLQLRERPMAMIPVKLPRGEEILLTSGGQNELIKLIVEEFCPRYTPGGNVIYIGDAGDKINDNEFEFFKEIGINIDKHGKMPDLVIEYLDKKWLIIIEAVTSHGPIDIERLIELKHLFANEKYGLVFITAFLNRKSMNKFLSRIAWESDVWVAESPSHLIHFNGDKFLGPYFQNE